MSINRAVHYTGRLSAKNQHCYSCLPRHSEFILQHSVSVDFDSVCKVSEDSFSGNTAIAQCYKEQVYWDLSGTLTASPRQPCHMVSFLLAGFYETQELQFRNSSNKTSTGHVSKGNCVSFYDTLMATLDGKIFKLWQWLHKTLKSLKIRAEHNVPTEAQIFNLIIISFAMLFLFLSPLLRDA